MTPTCWGPHALTGTQSLSFSCLKRSGKLLVMDVDKDGVVTVIDLVLLFMVWFASCLLLILCYFVIDLCDRKDREADEKHRSEKTRLVEADHYVKLEEDSDNESDNEMDKVVIDSSNCVHYNANTPIVDQLV